MKSSRLKIFPCLLLFKIWLGEPPEEPCVQLSGAKDSVISEFYLLSMHYIFSLFVEFHTYHIFCIIPAGKKVCLPVLKVSRTGFKTPSNSYLIRWLHNRFWWCLNFKIPPFWTSEEQWSNPKVFRSCRKFPVFSICLSPPRLRNFSQPLEPAEKGSPNLRWKTKQPMPIIRNFLLWPYMTTFTQHCPDPWKKRY